MEADIGNQYFESDLPDSVKGRVKTGQLFNLRQRKGADLASAVAQQEQIKSGNRMSLAGLTAGQNTTGTSNTTGQSTYSDPWGTGLQIAKLGIQGASM